MDERRTKVNESKRFRSFFLFSYLLKPSEEKEEDEDEEKKETEQSRECVDKSPPDRIKSFRCHLGCFNASRNIHGAFFFFFYFKWMLVDWQLCLNSLRGWQTLHSPPPLYHHRPCRFQFIIILRAVPFVSFTYSVFWLTGETRTDSAVQGAPTPVVEALRRRISTS